MFEFVVRVCFLRCISVGERRTCLCITTSQVDLQCDHSVSRLPPSRTIASSPQGPRPNQKKKPDRDLDSRVKRASFFFLQQKPHSKHHPAVLPCVVCCKVFFLCCCILFVCDLCVFCVFPRYVILCFGWKRSRELRNRVVYLYCWWMRLTRADSFDWSPSLHNSIVR